MEEYDIPLLRTAFIAQQGLDKEPQWKKGAAQWYRFSSKAYINEDLKNKQENTKINSINTLEQKLYLCGDYIFETGKVVMSFTIRESTFLQSAWLNYVAVRSRRPDGYLKAQLDSSNPIPIPENGNIPEPAEPLVIEVESGPESSGDMEAVYGQIRQYESTFHKAFIDRNFETAAEFYADDAILMPWSQNALRGKNEITE